MPDRYSSAAARAVPPDTTRWRDVLDVVGVLQDAR